MTTPTTVAQEFPMGWYVAPTLPVFTGESGEMSAEDFNLEVKRVLTAYPMGDEMAAYFVYSHLQGTARRELMLRDLEETNTPEKVINILLRVFGDGRHITTLLSTFFSREQLPEESTLDYSHALRSMGRTIRMKSTGALTAEMLRDHFIDGLQNPLLKRELRHILRKEPQTTFIQVRDEAVRLQQELEEDQRQQQAREQMAQLGEQLLLLQESVRSMQEEIKGFVSQRDGAVIGKGAVGRKRRNRGRKGKGQSVVGNGISPKVGKVLPKEKHKDSHNENQRDLPNSLRRQDPSLKEKTPVRTRGDCEDDPCQGEWVLLPIPPDPGIPGTCATWEGTGDGDCQDAVRSPGWSHRPVVTGLCENGTRSHPKPGVHGTCAGAMVLDQTDRGWKLSGSTCRARVSNRGKANHPAWAKIVAVAC
ncbi:uncharacterized protein LOC143296333 [Babylonia areolata]|uniref:uncharacterized protein LOC143296333 n=1 Tax=Babylonia areolata TaxID=304850 RepID=UPI003FD62155